EVMIEGLIEDGFLFHRWPGRKGMVRLMCPYTLSEQDIDCFLEAAGNRVSDIEIGGV
ncbi:uncharacterized protein METZ01_LOCUS433814, partial [marine metagenome]